MHPKNYGRYIPPDNDPEKNAEHVEHEEGERFKTHCVTCGSAEMGEVESFTEGVLWRCDECGEAMDLSVVH